MQYLHTMVRIRDIGESLDFFCNKMGMTEVRRYENEAGRFTLIFLAARDDVERGKAEQAPLLELTYNWPDENGNVEDYTGGRNFGHLAYRVDNIYETCQHLMDLASSSTVRRAMATWLLSSRRTVFLSSCSKKARPSIRRNRGPR